MNKHTNEILLLQIIKDKSDLFSITETKVEQYKKCSGVWTMWGKDIFDTDKCLEVAQTTDIFNELKYDLSYLVKDYRKENKSKRYSARRLFEFSKIFDVCECDSNRTCAKYRDIANSYYDIRVYLICNSNETREKRERIELKYAIDNEALYWNAWGQQRKDAKMYYSKRNPNY